MRRRDGLLAVLALSCVCAQARAATPIDLSSHAKAVATHNVGKRDSAPGHVLDGDPATYWHGDQQPLTETPANLIIVFDRTHTLGKVAVTSQVFKNILRLKDFEVYARAGDAWAGAQPLAVVTGFRRAAADLAPVTAECTFEPVTTDAIRIRIRDTWRPDHAFPRICEVRVWASEAKGRTPKPGPIKSEGPYERLLCDWAMGKRPPTPVTTFAPEEGYLHYARSFADTMLAKGTDIYGAEHSPMFTSILMLADQKHPGHRLPCIDGQRMVDRACFGANLHHDVMLLEAMDRLSELTGDARYKRGADAYLRFFLAHCPSRTTGLFPWGEHAHWDMRAEAPGHLTHEFLGAVPIAFWERLWRIAPKAVLGHADGLINHVLDLDTFTWSRHANIAQALPVPRPAEYSPADFPRHGGFYILLWTFAHAKTHDAKYLDWSMRAIDHHWRLTRKPSNLPPFTVRGKNAQMTSALSLAASLLEAAELLPAGKARSRYEDVANTYLASIARMPHKPADGWFATRCPLAAPPEQATGKTRPWAAPYGTPPTADVALMCAMAHRLTRRAGFLRLAEQAGEFYASHDPPPADRVVRAHVYASVLTLFLDLYDQTGEPDRLEQAKRYAKLAIERLYWRGLFRGATGIGHYESQMMVGNLVYGLVWLHALDKRSPVRVAPNYFNR